MTRLGKTVVFVVLVFVAVLVIYFISKMEPEEPVHEEEPEESVEVLNWPEHSIIGSSVEGLDIELYQYLHGSMEEGTPHVMFVGGIHGGYEWNSVLLAYELMDHLEENPDFLPGGILLSIVPSLNPDGVKAVTGKSGRFDPSDAPASREATAHGRFNANGVDLNRNFDCNWAPESTWRGEVVSAGTEPFSEPESKVFRDLVFDTAPDAVIFWHSIAGAVYGSECNDGILPGTMDIMNAYATASGYQAVPSFDHYAITGDVEGWLASVNIPSITVELTTHDDTEWEKNKAGVRALLEYFKAE